MLPEPGYSRKNPFPAVLEVNRRLTVEGSNKDTRHFEISIAGSGLSYEPGDSLGVVPSNPPELVELILGAQEFTGNEEVRLADGQSLGLREALLKHCIVTEPSKPLLQAVSEKDSSGKFLATLLD